MSGHENKKDWDTFKFYLDQVGESSKRSRLVLYLLLVSSAMIFAYDWKTYDESWLHSRIEIRHDVLSHWDDLTNNVPPVDMSNNEWVHESERMTSALSKIGLNPKNPEDKEILKWQLKDLEEQWNGTFKVPLIDISFDTNDFVLFSSLELLILTIVFLHALVREDENIQISFKVMKDEGGDSLKNFYRMASMQQIWTVPSSDDDGHETTKKFLRIGLWPIFFFPLFVMWWIYIRALMVSGAWNILNKSFGHEVLCIESISVLLVTLMAAWAAVVFTRTNKRWTAAYRDLSREREAAQRNPQPK